MNFHQRQQVDDFLRRKSEDLSARITAAVNESPVIKELVAEVNSLGIVCLLQHAVKVQLIVQENFVVPQDLSKVVDADLDKLFSAEDRRLWGNLLGSGDKP